MMMTMIKLFIPLSFYTLRAKSPSIFHSFIALSLNCSGGGLKDSNQHCEIITLTINDDIFCSIYHCLMIKSLNINRTNSPTAGLK